MSRCKKWPFVAANILLVAAIATACRSDSDDIEQTLEPTLVSTLASAAQADQESTTIEVTRIVVETQVVEVFPTPEPTKPKPKTIIICMREEPDSLYPYGRARLGMAAKHLQHGIYESMLTSLSYEYQARGIEKVPSLAGDDVVVKGVEVHSGEKVVDVKGDVVVLQDGVTVRTVEGDEVVFEGLPVVMPQMTVEFTLKPLVWSDGTPVTADDSVYSFELAADPQTPVPKLAIERTAEYSATGALTLEWTAIPGHMDKNYFANIWVPLPRHYWGEYSAVELLEEEIAGKMPLSHGPYVVSEWVEGDRIVLVKNPHYYLADEGYPRIENIIVEFVPDSGQLVARLLSGQCDIGTHEAIGMQEVRTLLDAEQSGALVPYFESGSVFEHIDFGIDPVDEYAAGRPDWFEDVRVRQAVVTCTDRQRMVDDILFGRGDVVDSYVPDIHPLTTEDIAQWPYDVATANDLLDEAGYVDPDGDGIRNDPQSGAPFRVTLLNARGNQLGQQVANIFKENLALCGIEVELSFLDSSVYFADGPEGPLFGRKFDLGAFPWLISIEPNCSLYLSTMIPGPDNNWNRQFNNETGFRDTDFDTFCLAALASLSGSSEYDENHREALRIWSAQLPAIPLFMRLKVAATQPAIQNFVLDATQDSELWNLYEIDVES